MVFYDNLLVACEKKGVKVTPLVIECGGASGSISNWKKGASPNSDIVLKLATRLNVSTDYLLTGKEKFLNDNLDLDIDQQELMEDYKTLSDIDKARVLERVKTLKELDDKNKVEAARRQKALAAAPIKKAKPKAVKLPEPEPTDEPEDENETEYEEEYFEIPLAELPASAGTGIYLDSDQTETIKVAANEKTRQTDFAVKVSGDSMEPRYYSGDIVLVRDEPVQIGEIGIFVYEGEGYIKKLGDGCLISLNPKYPNIQIENPDSLFCQGRVISVLRLVKKRR